MNKIIRAGVWISAGILLIAFSLSTVLKLGDFALHLSRPLPPFQLDFAAFYTAAAILNSDNPMVYDQQAGQDTAFQVFGTQVVLPPYIYPPLFAWMLRPLAMAPYQAAIIIWLLVNLLLAILLTRPLARTANLPLKPPVLLALFCLIWIFPLTGQTVFSVGQVNLVMLFLFVVISVNALPQKSPREQLVADVLAGLAIGLASGIKLFFAILLPYFWFYGRRRIAISGAITFLFSLVLGILGAGFENSRVYFLEVLPRLDQVSETLKLYSYSIAPAVERMFSATSLWRGLFFAQSPIQIAVAPLLDNPTLGIALGRAAAVAFGLAVLIIFVLDWKSNRKNPALQHDLRISLLLLSVMLLLQLSWSHSFILIIVPIVILLSPYRHWRLPWWTRYTLVAIACALIIFNLHWNYVYYLLNWQSLPFWVLFTGTLGVMIIMGILVFELLFDRDRKPERSAAALTTEGQNSRLTT